MKKTQQRFTRRVLAALLDSDFTETELREICEKISTDREYLHPLCSALGMMVTGLGEFGPEKGPLNRLTQMEQSVISAIQRARLSKSEVLDILQKINPNMVDYTPRSSSLRDLIHDFFVRSSSIEQHRFLTLIETGDSEDAYLRGILRRR